MTDLDLSYSFHIRGFYRAVVTDASGKVVHDSGLMPNLITTQGLDFFGSCTQTPTSDRNQAYANSCAVGTGNTAPTFGDTVLAAQIAVLNPADGGKMSGITYVAGPPAYYQGQRTWQFAAGTATGNIAEIGVGPYYSGTDSLPLFSRALVVDSGGNPTVIPVLSTEALSITYILQLYADLTDHSYSMSLSGTSYSGIWRIANCTTPINFLGIGAGMGAFVNPVLTVYSGAIGPTTSNPTGTSASTSISAPNPYVLGTYTQSYSGSYNINSGNVGGITAALWNFDIVPNAQMSISPAIPKTNAYNLTMNASISWSRYP